MLEINTVFPCFSFNPERRQLMEELEDIIDDLYSVVKDKTWDAEQLLGELSFAMSDKQDLADIYPASSEEFEVYWRELQALKNAVIAVLNNN